jgi:hypothetical protein
LCFLVILNPKQRKKSRKSTIRSVIYRGQSPVDFRCAGVYWIIIEPTGNWLPITRRSFVESDGCTLGSLPSGRPPARYLDEAH